jgi:hypothetical protein
MIKFFRKIRQNLLMENKTGKYLKYAVGEIILVIIGILIALNLNQRSEQRKEDAKIDAIFEDVLIELENDINNSTGLIRIYQRKDSVASLVLNTDLTFDDYANENSIELLDLVTNYSPYDTSNRAYNLLMENVDAIPDKYKKAVSILDALHIVWQPQLDNFNDHVWELVNKNHNDFEENYSWYSEPDLKTNKEAIAYRLNNFKYKNKVERYRGGAFSFRFFIGIYRVTAIAAYKEIAAILNKPTDSLKFIIDYKALVEYEGDYVNDSVPDSKINIALEDKFIRLKREGVEDNLLYSLSYKQLFINGNAKNRYYRFNKNNETDTITLTEYNGHEATTYSKINLDN